MDVCGFEALAASSRAALYSTTWLVALGSLAIYGVDALRPRPAQPAFFYVIVAPASWLLMAAAAGIARWSLAADYAASVRAPIDIR